MKETLSPILVAKFVEEREVLTVHIHVPNFVIKEGVNPVTSKEPQSLVSVAKARESSSVVKKDKSSSVEKNVNVFLTAANTNARETAIMDPVFLAKRNISLHATAEKIKMSLTVLKILTHVKKFVAKLSTVDSIPANNNVIKDHVESVKKPHKCKKPVLVELIRSKC